MDDNRIGDQVGKVGDALKDGAANVLEIGSDLAGKAQEASAAAGSTIRDAAVAAGSTIRDAAVETGKQVSDAAAKTYAQGTQAAEYVSRNTAEQPLFALLVAAAIGYGIAYMIHAR
jgi:hypothetical protein